MRDIFVFLVGFGALPFIVKRPAPGVMMFAGRSACGAPLFANRVWGTAEVVAAPEAGQLLAERRAAGFAAAVDALRANYPDRAATRRYAERFSWDDSSAGQLAVFKRILAQPAAACHA